MPTDPCKGICKRYKAIRPLDGKRYRAGQKRCQYCDVFLMWDGSYCPCCGCRLRTKPRMSKYKIQHRKDIIEQNRKVAITVTVQ